MAKILLVEDDSEFAEAVQRWLEHEHHTVESVADGTDAHERLNIYKYDVLILDWELPGMSGVDICKKYRATGGTAPILILTGKSAVSEKETGLDAGADDYLTKPFHMKEMAARVRALLRRTGRFNETTLKVRNIVLEPGLYNVTRDGVELRLLPKEFALLEFFMRHPGEVFSAEALLDRVWISEADITPDAVVTCIKRLRKKVDLESEPSIIRTIHGVGYKLQP
jgi:OmpR-family two-component system manganese-sensing response regulator